jgi:hypothetical protein
MENYRVQDIFALDEEKLLLKALSRSSPDATLTEDEYVQLMSWACLARRANNTLELLMTQAVKPVFEDGDIKFEPTENLDC